MRNTMPATVTKAADEDLIRAASNEKRRVSQEHTGNDFTSQQHNNGKEQPQPEKVHDHPMTESDDRAWIERLGRRRPAKFKSFGAELAFCYSVIASQFMSVSEPNSFESLHRR